MRYVFPIFFVLIACEAQEEQGMNDSESNEDRILILTDSSHTDTVNEYVDPRREDLRILLDEPLDLVAYKKEWGTSNSSPATNKELYNIPDTVGMMYRYMLFHKLRMELPSHPDEGQLFHGFIITVYKYGDKIGDFYDTNEELIMVECSFDNPTLGELNWTGKSKDELIDKYDSAKYVIGQNWIYEHNNQVITAHFDQSNRVDWFKYVRLNKKINLNQEVPELLLNF